MLFRMDSDVPVPSGRTLLLTSAEKPEQRKRLRKSKMKEKTKLVAIMVSNCGGRNRRWEYVRQLRKHVPVDVYGACGNLRCVRICSMLLVGIVNPANRLTLAEHFTGVSTTLVPSSMIPAST
jgi:hypothetical protein